MPDPQDTAHYVETHTGKPSDIAEFRADTTARDKGRNDLPWPNDDDLVPEEKDSADAKTKNAPGHRQTDSGESESRGNVGKKS